MYKPTTIMHFGLEAPANYQESRVNEDLQKDDDKPITYEYYDVCEVI